MTCLLIDDITYPLSLTNGYVPGQFLHQLRIDQLNFVLDLGISGDGDGVFQHHERQGRIVQGLLLRLSYS